MEPTIRERLETDMKDAMRSGDTQTRDAVRYILAAVKNAEIEARANPKAPDALATLKKLGKQLADAADQYRQGGREDLAVKEDAQLVVLKRYLPAEMSDADLAALADQVAAEIGATGPKDMAKMMPALIAKAGDQADGRRVNQAAKAALAKLGG